MSASNFTWNNTMTDHQSRYYSTIGLFFFIAALLFLSSGCSGTEATEGAEECAQSDLIAQCPVGSNPRLDARATSQCEGKAQFDLIEENGEVTGSCSGTGDCVVVCDFVVPCNCGVETLTTETLQCVNPCPACGDGVCEGGESATACPSDCGVVCNPGDARCNGDDRDVCSQNGTWETLACPSNQSCNEPTTNQATCQ